MSWYHEEPFGAFWERGYRDPAISCMGGPSFEVGEVATLLPAGARVLDLGCGEGRNALFMASLGYSVTAVDRSAAGIQKLKAMAAASGVALEALVGDIGSLELEGEFDCVLAHGVLYYLENAVWRRLLSQVKSKTRPGGFNVFTVFIYNDEYPCTDEIQAARYKNSFRPNELQEFYADWQELRFDRYVKWDSHPGVPLHYHPIEKLVSRKPGGKDLGIEKRAITNAARMSAERFAGIAMGLTRTEVIERVGEPDVVDRMDAKGLQYGMSLQKGASLAPAAVNGYALELWFYGPHVLYLSNGVVSGRAVHATPPARIAKADR